MNSNYKILYTISLAIIVEIHIFKVEAGDFGYTYNFQLNSLMKTYEV